MNGQKRVGRFTGRWNRWLFASTLVLGVVMGCCGTLLCQRQSKPLVHRLKAPLQIWSSDPASPPSTLPVGTHLYFDQAYPEGFVRFKVYVNVEGVLLESKEVSERFWLDPLSAQPLKGLQ